MRVRRLAGIWLPLLLSLFLIYIGLAIHHEVLFTFINGEDCLWINGSHFGWMDRSLQRYLLHELYRRHLGWNVEVLYVAAVGLHIVIALQLYLFFHALVTSVKVPPLRGRHAAHLGGALAGLLYLLYHSSNLTYLSAVSYQLCLIFYLQGLVFVLWYLRDRNPLWWLAVVATWLLALNNHTFSYGFPLSVMLLEVYHRRSRGWRQGWGRTLLRYGLLAAVPAVHFVTLYPVYLAQWKKTIPAPLAPVRELYRFSDFLTVTLEHYLIRFGPWNMAQADHILFKAWPQPEAVTTLLMVSIMAAAVSAAAVTAFNLLRRRAVGVPGIFILMVLAWNLPIYLQVRVAPYLNEASWRYEHPVVGYCFFFAFLGLSLGASLLERLPRRAALPASTPALLIFVPLAVFSLAASLADQRSLLAAFSSPETLSNQSSCLRAPRCKARPRITRSQLAKGGSLACADLSNQDLSGMDLRGRDLSGANLSGANLNGARLDGARMSGACLNWASLDGAVLEGADLRGVRLTGASVEKARFCGADITELKDACASRIISMEMRMKCPAVAAPK